MDRASEFLRGQILCVPKEAEFGSLPTKNKCLSFDQKFWCLGAYFLERFDPTFTNAKKTHTYLKGFSLRRSNLDPNFGANLSIRSSLIIGLAIPKDEFGNCIQFKKPSCYRKLHRDVYIMVSRNE